MHEVGQLDIKSLDDKKLVSTYSSIVKEMKTRKLIRSKNIVGDLGEYIALDAYNSRRNLPKLQLAMSDTKNVDATSRDGERYSMKTVTLPNKTTGVFYGLQEPGSKVPDVKNFEHVIIVILDEELSLVELIEINWETFIQFKKWHSRMRAWNISITDGLRKSATRTIRMPSQQSQTE